VPSNQRTVFSSSSSFPFLIVLSRLPPCWQGWADPILETPSGLACSVHLASIVS
jgi:hypothetical protein